MEGESPPGPGQAPTKLQARAIGHREGPLLLSGPAGSGRSEALVRRLESLADAGVEPQYVLVLTRSRAGAARLRERAGTLVDPPYEELWIATYEAAAGRLLSEYALEAGLDPFFATVRLADRLALLLDHLDDLSLRRHEIRGNPAGLLARLLRRIDALKAEGISPGRLRDWAEERERESAIAQEKERARREREFAELYASHDRILRENGSLDAGDLVIELERLLRERADVRREVSTRFPFVMVDELEDAGAAHRALIDAAAEHQNLVCACDTAQSIRRPPAAVVDPGPSFMERYPEAAARDPRPARCGSARRWRRLRARWPPSPGMSAPAQARNRAMTGPRWCASGARRPSARRRRRRHGRSSTCSPPVRCRPRRSA